MRKLTLYFILFGGWIITVLGIMANDFLLAVALWSLTLFVLITLDFKTQRLLQEP